MNAQLISGLKSKDITYRTWFKWTERTLTMFSHFSPFNHLVNYLNQIPSQSMQSFPKNQSLLQYFISKPKLQSLTLPKIGHRQQRFIICRDVIRSPDVLTFESFFEVRIQFLHPDIRIKYLKCKKVFICVKKILLYYHTTRKNMIAFSRTSDFTDEMTSIGDNCHRYVFFWKHLIDLYRFLSDSHVSNI